MPVWTPSKQPPGYDEATTSSEDARIILQALREAHWRATDGRNRVRQARSISSSRDIPAPDPQTYYQSLYSDSFKNKSKSSQSSTNEQCAAVAVVQPSQEHCVDSVEDSLLNQVDSVKNGHCISGEEELSREDPGSLTVGETSISNKTISAEKAGTEDVASISDEMFPFPNLGEETGESTLRSQLCTSPPIDTDYYQESQSDARRVTINSAVATTLESCCSSVCPARCLSGVKETNATSSNMITTVTPTGQLGSFQGMGTPHLVKCTTSSAADNRVIETISISKPIQKRLIGLKTNYVQRTFEETAGNDSTPSVTVSNSDCQQQVGYPHQSCIRNVVRMNSTQRSAVGASLDTASEVCMCVVYKDGTSQLREADVTSKKRKCLDTRDGIVRYLLVACIAPQPEADLGTGGASGAPEVDVLYNKNNSSNDNNNNNNNNVGYFSFPLTEGEGDKDCKDWCRTTLLTLMASKTVQKVCFDAQEMIHSLICSYDLDHTVVSSSWLVLDPKVASWLLDADHPPVTFTELLAKYLPAEENKPVSATSQLSACHSLTMLRSVMKRLFMSLNEAYLWQLFVDVEMKLCPILAAMEVQGLCTRSETLKEYGKLLQERLESIEQQVYKSAGHPFQITSHVQLRHVLFDELGLDKKHQGKRLARTNVQNLKSTSEAVLVKLQALHPLPKLVLKYRQLSKLKSTYIDGILDCVQNGYVQTSWEQTSAASGRLQSANPNLQNIPKQPVYLDDEESMIILARRPFVSHVGWSLMTADFQSIELRLLAHLSNDHVLLQVFNKKDSPDIFLELTAQWLGVPASEVGTADRERSKRLVYSIVYGVGPDKLAETLKVSKEEAKSFSKSFLARFPGVGAFTRRCISRCRKHGFVQTILRRRRLIPNINSCDFHNRCYAERQSVNFVVQGSAADICKLAMIRVVQQLALRPELRARLLVQIHDELLLEVADEDIVEVRGVVKNAMEVTLFCCGPEINIQVPLPVSIAVGKNWSQLSET